MNVFLKRLVLHLGIARRLCSLEAWVLIDGRQQTIQSMLLVSNDRGESKENKEISQHQTFL